MFWIDIYLILFVMGYCLRAGPGHAVTCHVSRVTCPKYKCTQDSAPARCLGPVLRLQTAVWPTLPSRQSCTLCCTPGSPIFCAHGVMGGARGRGAARGRVRVQGHGHGQQGGGCGGVAGTLAVPRAGAAECEGRAGPRTPAPAPATDCTLLHRLQEPPCITTTTSTT